VMQHKRKTSEMSWKKIVSPGGRDKI